MNKISIVHKIDTIFKFTTDLINLYKFYNVLPGEKISLYIIKRRVNIIIFTP